MDARPKKIDEDEDIFLRDVHVKFFKRILEGCPAAFSEFDCYRLMFAFFCLSGLDMLNALHELTSDFKKSMIEWVYHLQVVPDPDCASEDTRVGGFQGTSTMMVSGGGYEDAHITMTYTGLCCLLILGDDLSRVNKPAVIEGVRRLQMPDGSFCGTRGSESDMRFVYSAACICYILNDMSGINMDTMIKYICDSVGYDGALGQGPGLEAHGGSTFCGLAALQLTDNFHILSPKQIERMKRWCIMRQKEGFKGRPHKPQDTCYSFWVGGSLALLGATHWVSAQHNRAYILSTQDRVVGGFAKWPNSQTECLHAFFGLAGLSLNGEEGVAPIEPLLCITKRAHAHLKQLHTTWL